MTTLYTKCFKVAGILEPSNIYPLANSEAERSLTRLLEKEQADTWNTKLNNDNRCFDYDTDVWDTAQDQLERNLLSEALTKEQIDNIFGKGRRRGIRRRGIWQNGKFRGVDGARSSGTNLAAWLRDTIMTTPHDIAIQIIC